MSRTYKDKPHKFSAYAIEREQSTARVPCIREYTNIRTGELVEYVNYVFFDVPGSKKKKRKEVDTVYHWMSTPSWWTRMYMRRPQRARENQQLRNIRILEDFDFVDTGRKPHVYYW